MADRTDGYFDPANEPFELIQAADLDNLPDRNHLFFKYDVLELNCALKPYLLEHLFVRHSLTKLIYFDSDIMVFSPLTRIIGDLQHFSLILTPHLTSPIEDTCFPSELDILRSGTFNMGFLGITWNAHTTRFLKWWQTRVFRRCELAPSEGVLLDQKWMELAPSFIDRVEILRDPTFNVAYWNYHDRVTHLRFVDGRLTMKEEPVGFFHFSGLDPDDIEQVSRHQSRYTLTNLPQLRPLFEFYRDRLYQEGYRISSRWPYAYARFEDGTAIPASVRVLYRGMGAEALSFGDPFKTNGEHSFLTWLNQPYMAARGQRDHEIITRLHWNIYERSPDLRQRYPKAFGPDRSALWNWLKTKGTHLHGLSDHYFPAPQTFGVVTSITGLVSRARLIGFQLLFKLRSSMREVLMPLLKSHPRVRARLRALDERLF